jgi:hypothetical protein
MSQTTDPDRFEFPLGAVVEDVQTGLSGVVIAISEHITRCERYGVQPDSGTGSKRPSEQFYYSDELKMLKDPEDGPFAEQAENATTDVEIELGQVAQDDISGARGYVTTITYQLLNCPRVAIRPATTDPTETKDRQFFDTPRMRVVNDGVADEYDGLTPQTQQGEMAAAATGAPESDLERKSDLE